MNVPITKNEMKIAIIDSGVDSNHTKLKDINLSGFGIKSNGAGFSYIKDYSDEFGHGTAIAGIIHKHTKDLPNVELIIIKIFFDHLIANEEIVIEAIRWCINNDVKVINLSLGIEKNNPPQNFYNVCKLAYDHNTLIIAASNNVARSKHKTYPASFPTVFGVDSGLIKKNKDYGYVKNNPIEFLAKGTTQRVLSNNGKFNIVQGVSFACAHFSGIVVKLIEDPKLINKNIEDIKMALIENSASNIKPWINYNPSGEIQYQITNVNLDYASNELFNNSKKFLWIRNVAIFPTCEKEMSLFAKMKSTSVKVQFLIDYPRQVKSVFNEANEFLLSINRVPNASELKKIDSFVIGYYLDQLFEGNIHFGDRLLELAISNNKNIYYFDKRLERKIDELKEKYNYTAVAYCPVIQLSDYNDLKPFKFLPEVNIPVIAVVGTSSKQGKFTTQLRILGIMEKEGYKVGFLSTEPHGELFSASYSFPYGYSSTVNIGSNNWLDFLDKVLKGIQFYNTPNLILTGIQSSIIPRVYDDHACYQSVLNSLTFLQGIKPDVFICAINPDDDIEDVMNTIEATKIYTGAKFLFCVLSPFRRTDEEGYESHRKISNTEFHDFCEKIIYKLNIPVIDVMDSDNDNFILEAIENSLIELN